jgi:hypothetical protein
MGGVLKFRAVAGGGNDAVVQVASLGGATISSLATQQRLTSPVGVEVVQFAVDNNPPDAPKITAIADNTGNASDRLTADRTPELTVSAEPGARLVLGSNGQALPTSSYTVLEWAASPGTYTVRVLDNLSDGGYGLVAIDAAGNMSAAPQGSASSAAFMIDGSSPGQASIVALVDDTGALGNDRVTRDTTPLLTLTAEPGATLKVGQDGIETTVAYSVTEDTPGHYTIAFTGNLSDGTYGVRVIDAAGNKDATVSSGAKFTIDTTAPAAPTVAEQGSADLADGRMDAAEAASTTLRVAVPATGVLPGDKVELLQGGAAFTAPKVVTLGASEIAAGHVDFTVLAADLGPDGVKSLTAAITDLAGNTGKASAPVAFTLEATAVPLSAGASTRVMGTDGRDTFAVVPGEADTVIGGGGDDVLFGLPRGPVTGERGQVVFVGGAGNDLHARIGDGDVFVGGGGQDAVWLDGSSMDFLLQPATQGQVQTLNAELHDLIADGSIVAAEVGNTWVVGTRVMVDPGGAGPQAPEPSFGTVAHLVGVERVEFGVDGFVRDLDPNFQRSTP